jgi:hypothetical protein
VPWPTYSNSGGGGGGGRIAAYIVKAPFYRIRYTVNGGGCSGTASPGSPGSIYQNFKTRGTVWSTW